MRVHILQISVSLIADQKFEKCDKCISFTFNLYVTRRVFFTEIKSNHSYSKHKLDTEFDKDSETSVFESDNAVTGLDESSGKSESSYSSSTDSKEERRRK